MCPINFTQNLPKIKLVYDRASLIVDYCKNKNVLHLGCVESGATSESFRNNSLLHLKIMGVAKKVIGMDIDQEGLNYLGSHGIPDIIYGDAQNLDNFSFDTPIDIIVAGEILEHLPNPGLFLNGIHRFISKNNHDIVLLITVPNAFSIIHFMSLFLNKKELIMPDHNFYFSYSTLKTLLERNEFQLTDFYTYSNLEKNRNPLKRIIKGIFNKTIFRFSPQIAQGLIAVAVKKS